MVEIVLWVLVGLAVFLVLFQLFDSLYLPPTWMTPPPQNEEWVCPYCKSKNDFEAENCCKCGAPESH